MNRLSFRNIAPAAVLFLCGLAVCDPAAAQDEAADEGVPESLELTMTLMPEGADRPEVVTRTIELPPAASSQAVEASERGLGRANAARENRQEGLDAAAEARERGREFGEEMAEQARENRADAGRGETPPPGGPPDDIPGPPDRPQD